LRTTRWQVFVAMHNRGAKVSEFPAVFDYLGKNREGSEREPYRFVFLVRKIVTEETELHDTEAAT